jgi:prepilin-type processing-associated H-X9-DG protein
MLNRTNAFAIGRILGYSDMNVVFVDGHAISFAIDEVWHKLFKRVFYIRHLEPTTCFDRAVFISWGYVAPRGVLNHLILFHSIWRGNWRCRRVIMYTLQLCSTESSPPYGHSVSKLEGSKLSNRCVLCIVNPGSGTTPRCPRSCS